MRKLALVASGGLILAALSGPVGRPLSAAQPPDLPDPVFAPQDEFPPVAAAPPTARQLKRRFEQARTLLDSGNEAEGIRVLQSILDSEEDEFFAPDSSAPDRERSLKSEAQSLLQGLSGAARELYEKQYGPAARRLLAEALAESDADRLAEVVRRFFQTESGQEAAYRLASDHLDHGRPLTAVLGFERLRGAARARPFEPALSLKTALAWRRAGRDDRAVECLKALKQELGNQDLILGGRTAPLFAEVGEALHWLERVVGAPTGTTEGAEDQWIQAGGDSRRNAAPARGAPYLRERWRASTVAEATHSPDDDGLVARAIQERSRAAAGEESAAIPLIPYAQPLVVGHLAVVRGIGDVRAYELDSGRLAWAASEKDTALLQALQANAAGAQSGVALVSLLIGQRLGTDATVASLSSDGELVFAVEDVEFPFPYPGTPPGQVARMVQPRPFNRLVAYEARTGKMAWEAGGPVSQGDDDSLFGASFLGAPLVLDRRLYCLTESGSDIRLVSLDPRSGEIVWSQTLHDDADLHWDFHRRRSGLSPSYDGGILVCPTGSDQATAVDLTARSLLWRYRLRPRAEAYDPRPLMLPRGNQRNAAQSLPRTAVEQKHWLDSLPLISEARVVFTPRDGNELHCVNLLDGAPVWKAPRGEALWVAGIQEGKVIVVGRSFVQALSLADGAPVWSEPAAIPAPSGRGVMGRRQFHLPLSTAEVATIDLTSGRIVSRARSPAERAPGNLVSAGRQVISQGADFVEAFPLLESLADEVALTLAESPDDPGALAIRGELRLQQGLVREGFDDLEQALALAPADTAVRELLVSSLLEGLRVDFEGYRGLAERFEELLAGSEAGSTALWLRAAGLQRSGELAAAFAALLRFADPAATHHEFERQDGVLTVRRDRLVRSRAQQLLAAATGPERDALQAAWREQVARLEVLDDPGSLRRFLESFQGTFDARPLERRYLQSAPGGDWLREELTLSRIERGSDAELAAHATARLAALLLTAERPRDAALLIEQIERQWPDQPSLEGRTGREQVALWKALPEVGRALTPAPAWPAGRVDAEREPSVTQQLGRPHPIPLSGERGPFFQNVTLEVSSRLQDLVARDGLGKVLWKLSLGGQMETAHFPLNRAYACEHLLLVTLGPELLAIDSLGAADAPGPRILWRMNLMDPSTAGVILPRANANFRRRMPIIQAHELVGTVGPVTTDYIAVTRGRRLLALDPLSGKPLWIRDGVSLRCELFGDEDLLFYVPPDAAEVGVFRALDGTFVGTRRLPAATAGRLDTIGRNAVLWQSGNARQTLTLHDVAGERDVWRREFAPGSLVTLIDQTEAAVLDPAGGFSVVSLADGRDVLQSTVDPPVDVHRIVVLRSRDRYVLVCVEPAEDNNQQFTFVAQHSVRVDGHVHGIDRSTGERLWTVPVERQGLDPAQTGELPVLTFLSQTNVRQANAPTFLSQFRLLCLDRRTGRILYKDEQVNEALHFVDYLADPDLFQLEVRLFRSTLRLTFTDQPWPD